MVKNTDSKKIRGFDINHVSVKADNSTERPEAKEEKRHCWAKKKYKDCPAEYYYGRCKNCRHYKEIEL